MDLTYATGSVISIIALLIAPRILQRMGGYKFLLLIVGLDALTVLTFATAQEPWLIVLAFIFSFALNMVIIFSLDELLKIFSQEAGTGGARGAYLTLNNIAWILSQVIFIFAAMEGLLSFRIIYFLAFAVMMVLFLLIFLSLKNTPDPHYDRIRSLKYVWSFFKNKNLRRSFGINLLLQLFYSVMVIYTPIYLATYLHFSWREIGMIFAIMLTPFTILPFMEGTYSDKVGERKMLMLGFFISSLATLALFFLKSTEIWAWAVALFLTRVGAATIETMNDSYFFKHIKPENEEWVGIYRSAPGAAYVIGPLSALAIFAFVPSFNFIFVIVSAVLFYGVYLASTIRKSDI
ncbi:MAG: MFS transporter [Candidatus Paceibacterota bacterium]|jgi:MFS family permease